MAERERERQRERERERLGDKNWGTVKRERKLLPQIKQVSCGRMALLYPIMEYPLYPIMELSVVQRFFLRQDVNRNLRKVSATRKCLL